MLKIKVVFPTASQNSVCYMICMLVMTLVTMMQVTAMTLCCSEDM